MFLATLEGAQNDFTDLWWLLSNLKMVTKDCAWSEKQFFLNHILLRLCIARLNTPLPLEVSDTDVLHLRRTALWNHPCSQHLPVMKNPCSLHFIYCNALSSSVLQKHPLIPAFCPPCCHLTPWLIQCPSLQRFLYTDTSDLLLPQVSSTPNFSHFFSFFPFCPKLEAMPWSSFTSPHEDRIFLTPNMMLTTFTGTPAWLSAYNPHNPCINDGCCREILCFCIHSNTTC